MMGSIHDALGRIEAQTIKTNGGLTKAKEDIVEIQNWQFYMKGGIAIIGVCILPVALYLITTFITIKK